MEAMTVKDLMVPVEEYATVSEEATLFEAIMALEKAQEKLDQARYKYLHMAILVYDKNKKIVGKLSQLDALRALEPKYAGMGVARSITRTGFSPEFLKDMLEKHSLWDESPEDICKKAVNRKIKGYMHAPTEGEYIEEEASMREAAHLLVMGHHQSLLVTRDKEIVGILRMTDVFMVIFQLMKSLNP